MDELQTEILEELKIEMGITLESDIAILNVKLKNAIREVKQAINYPASFTDEEILADLENYIGNIKDVAMYDYNLIGTEGQTAHSENGVNRTWKSRTECFHGIVRYASV